MRGATAASGECDGERLGYQELGRRQFASAVAADPVLVLVLVLALVPVVLVPVNEADGGRRSRMGPVVVHAGEYETANNRASHGRVSGDY